MKGQLIGRFRQVRDVLIIMWARRWEYRGDPQRALGVLQKRSFRSNLGGDLGDLYRLRLMVVTRDPAARQEARRLVKNPSKMRGVQGFYFRAYSKYLYAILADDIGRERKAIEELDVLNVGNWLRRLLPYFEVAKLQTG